MRTMWIWVLILVPATAMGQGQGQAAGSAGTAQPFDTRAIVATTVLEPAPRITEQPQPPQPPVRRARRRGSMVGYVEDAFIGSRVRVRFDSALENTAPDRAEFFYAKCGCYQDLSPTDTAYDPEAPGPRPGAAADLNFQELYVTAEYAANRHFSVFGQLPMRWVQPQSFLPGTGAGFANQRGLGDIRAGIKLGMVETDSSIVTVQVQGFFPTGEASQALGTDHFSLEQALLLYQRASDRVAIEAQFGAWLPFDGSKALPTTGEEDFAGRLLYYGIGPSFEVHRGDRVQFAPVVELVGWHLLDGSTTGLPDSAGGTNIVNLKVGARTSWDDRASFYVGYGKALTEATWYEQIFRVEYRYRF